MDIQAEKLSLIQWLADITEPSIIKKIMALRKEERGDWWDNITEEEKNDINKGLQQIENGETYTHAEVMASYQKWLLK